MSDKPLLPLYLKPGQEWKFSAANKTMPYDVISGSDLFHLKLVEKVVVRKSFIARLFSGEKTKVVTKVIAKRLIERRELGDPYKYGAMILKSVGQPVVDSIPWEIHR
jgi:hypothetical protein